VNKEVIVIPHMDRGEERLLVAVYARVSTKAERQSDSLENQIAHYRESMRGVQGRNIIDFRSIKS